MIPDASYTVTKQVEVFTVEKVLRHSRDSTILKISIISDYITVKKSKRTD